MDEGMKNNFKITPQKIVTALVVVALLYLVFSGKISLFGSSGGSAATGESTQGIPLVTGQASAGTTAAPTTAARESSKAAAAQESTTAKATAKATTAAPTKATTQAPAETHVPRKEYYFRNKSLLNDHYDKHGKEMGFKSAAEYEKAASDVINNPAALYKTEKEDGDHVFYVEATNEFVVLSKDGYIRTYFNPSSGKKYFDRQ